MLFLLSKELTNYEHLNTDTNINGLKKLLSGGFEGHHIVLAEKRDVFKRLIELGETGDFDNEINGYLKKMMTQFASQRGIERDITPCYVVPSGVATDNKKYIELEELHKFSFSPTYILAENINDAHIYMVAGYHAIKQKAYMINISCKLTGGGGSAIVGELRGILNENNCIRFCLSITDSDKRYPNCSTSKTTEECMELVEKKNKNLYKHYELPVRAIENLIPIKIIEKIINKKGIRNEELNNLKNIINNYPDVRVYGNIKKGTYFKNLPNKDKDKDEMEFIENIIQKNNIKKYDCCDKNKCEHYIIPKVCQNICSEFKDFLEKDQDYHLLDDFDGDWRKDWLDIGEIVIEFCCAFKKMRA